MERLLPFITHDTDKVKGLYEPSRTLDNPSLDLEWWNAQYEGSDKE